MAIVYLEKGMGKVYLSLFIPCITWEILGMKVGICMLLLHYEEGM
jgi:hypothetical protein